MKNPALRVVLALLALGAAGGAGYYAFTLEQRAAALLTAERGFGEDVLRLQATLAELRAAQAGYLAIGQDAAVWIQKAAQLRQQADGQLKQLTSSPLSPDLDADLGTVGEALASIGRLDRRTAELLRQEETLAASALIFNESAQVIAAASATLSRARGAAASKAGSVVAALRRQQLYAAAGGGAVVLLVLLLLVPVRRRSEPAAEGEEAATASSDTTLFAPVPQPAPGHVGLGSDLDLALERRMGRGHDVEEQSGWPDEADHESKAEWGDPAREKEEASVVELRVAPMASGGRRDAEGARREPEGGRWEAEGARREPEGGRWEAEGGRWEAEGGPGDQASGLGLAPGTRVDLAAAAQLCTDLARVRETSELQGLLARAATLLDASGIVVWMGGSRGTVLWPAFSHGYTPQALSKMQALPREGATPVSSAFRSGLMEVVPGENGTTGAIVAPILSSNGCVGVMAVEIRHGAETSDAEQALAGILAAQLATLVAGEQG